MSETAETKQTDTRPGKRFVRISLMVTALLIVLVCAGTIVLYYYVHDYEITLPDNIISDYLSNIDYEFWTDKAAQDIKSQLTRFEIHIADEITELYRGRTYDVNYTMRKRNDGSGENTLAYTLRAGAADIGIVTLEACGKSRFGFTIWEIGTIEYLPSFTGALPRDIAITVSQNAEVSVNGIPVTGEYEIPSDTWYARAYHIGGLFGEADIQMRQWDGSTDEPYYAENGIYYYPVIIPFSQQYSITAPKGVNVFIGGSKLSAADIAQNDIIPEVLSGLVSAEDAPLLYSYYETVLTDIYYLPEVTYENVPEMELVMIEAEPGYFDIIPAYSQEYKDLYEKTAETFIRAYVNHSANQGGAEGFSTLEKYMLRNSELYIMVRSAKFGIYDIPYMRAVFKSLEIDNFRPYGDDYFTCEISFDVDWHTNRSVLDMQGDFVVVFKKSGSNWYAIRMVTL